MLERLEGADGHAELLAELQIVERAFEGGAGRAEHFGGQTRAAGVERGVQGRETGVDRADDRLGADADPLEPDVGGVAAVDPHEPGADEARRVGNEMRAAIPAGPGFCVLPHCPRIARHPAAPLH